MRAGSQLTAPEIEMLRRPCGSRASLEPRLRRDAGAHPDWERGGWSSTPPPSLPRARSVRSPTSAPMRRELLRIALEHRAGPRPDRRDLAGLSVPVSDRGMRVSHVVSEDDGDEIARAAWRTRAERRALNMAALVAFFGFELERDELREQAEPAMVLSSWSCLRCYRARDTAPKYSRRCAGRSGLWCSSRTRTGLGVLVRAEVGSVKARLMTMGSRVSRTRLQSVARHVELSCRPSNPKSSLSWRQAIQRSGSTRATSVNLSSADTCWRDGSENRGHWCWIRAIVVRSCLIASDRTGKGVAWRRPLG